MEFKILNQLSQLDEIDEKSKIKLQLIFKHSTTCGTSYYSHKNLLKDMKNVEDEAFDIYYLDLLELRNISNAIAERYFVRHESPQLLLIKDGECIRNGSHSHASLELV